MKKTGQYETRDGAKAVILRSGDKAQVALAKRKGQLIQNYMDFYVTDDGGVIVRSEIQMIVLPRADNSIALRVANPPL